MKASDITNGEPKVTLRHTSRIVADETHPEMHRVRWPDGGLSDMANLSRANDATARFNETLERELRGRQKPLEGFRGLGSQFDAR